MYMINMIKKKIKQHFCCHDVMKEVDVFVHYEPLLQEPNGSYYKHKKLKCVECGKIFR